MERSKESQPAPERSRPDDDAAQNAVTPRTARDFAVAALATIDEERAKMRDARNALAASEAAINLAMARLHAYFVIEGGKS